jgi:hypothetical protein
MARAHVRQVLQNPDGSVLTGAEVRVLQDGSLTLISQTLYTDDTGSATLTNPFTCTDGVVEFYLVVPERVRLGYTPPGGTEQFATVDAESDASGLVQAAAAFTITNAPVPDKPLVGNSDGETATFKDIPPPSGAPTGAGETEANPATTFYMQSASHIWAVTMDDTGHFVSTAVT